MYTSYELNFKKDKYVKAVNLLITSTLEISEICRCY